MTKKAKITKTILGTLWWLLVVVLAILLIIVISAKFRGEVPQICGFSIMKIVSGSMEDTIPTGSYILVKRTAPEDIEKEDIISFYSDDRAIYGMPNTHRVKDIIFADGEFEFVTQGDATSVADPVNAKGDRLIGVYVTTLSGLSAFSDFLSGGGTFIILMVLGAATFALVGLTMYKKLKATNTDEEDNDNSESK